MKTISSTAIIAVISNRTQNNAHFKIRKQKQKILSADDDENKKFPNSSNRESRQKMILFSPTDKSFF